MSLVSEACAKVGWTEEYLRDLNDVLGAPSGRPAIVGYFLGLTTGMVTQSIPGALPDRELLLRVALSRSPKETLDVTQAWIAERKERGG